MWGVGQELPCTCNASQNCRTAISYKNYKTGRTSPSALKDGRLFKQKKKCWILKIEIVDMNKKKFASFYSSRHGKNRRHTCASRMGRTRTQDLAVTRQRVANCTTRVLRVANCTTRDIENLYRVFINLFSNNTKRNDEVLERLLYK